MAFDKSKDASAVLEHYYDPNQTPGYSLSASQVCVGAANFYGCMLSNQDTAAPGILFLYDAADAGAVTPGIDIPVFIALVPTGGSLYISPERAKVHFKNGIVAAAGADFGPGSPGSLFGSIWFSQS